MSQRPKFTTRQVDFLIVLLGGPLPPGEIAFRCGYRGRPANHGGAGRAPMWTGRMFHNINQIDRSLLTYVENCRIGLTHAGRRLALQFRRARDTAACFEKAAPDKGATL
jgi:hypothetical protein